METLLRERLFAFTYLQLLDLLTTMVFLLQGIPEGNPVVRSFMLTSNPFVGLVLVKMAAVAMAGFCWRTGRYQLLMRGNIFFAGLIVWNLVAMLVQALSRSL